MRAILHILRKEFLQLRRDPNIVRLIFIGPIMQLLIFGFAINLDVNSVPMIVCDLDHSLQSHDFIARFENSGYFPIVAYVNKMSDIDDYLVCGKASIALTIPREFGRKLSRGEPAPIQAIVDGSESNAASVGLNYAAVIVAGYSQDVMLSGFARKGLGMLKPITVQPEIRVWYNPDLKSRNYILPSLLGMILMQATVVLTALAIVKEKEQGTMEQLIVTPVKTWQIIVGKLAPFTIIGMIDILLALAGVTLLFGIPVRGSIITLGWLSVLFILTTLGIGLFVSTVSSTQQQAMMTAMFFVMLPMNFLSGFIFPIENMPKLIQVISYLLPLRYFFEIIRGIFLRGAGLDVLWPQVLALFIFATAILTLSALRFRKKLA
ncbi:MAG: ABC transporter permease [Bacteroidota bacterium]|nr:ABC transporter permease [Bacteroidota bacterium]MDP4231820.1 ABC transporter permease [Bacteroidota bacterium]MDP4242706.1 ABC transporter permease [Bacteroidota bacterium]MDP4287157.1 ABC transporter permease [Bacteroidota bacterium]